MCTTKACIVDDLQKSLVGGIAQDEAVATKVKCYKSTVKHNAGNTWTATCKVSYSDGSSVTGFGNLIPDKDKVTFQPAGT
jgi:hypothetical protein